LVVGILCDFVMQLCKVVTTTKTGAELCSVDGFVCRGLDKEAAAATFVCHSEAYTDIASYSYSSSSSDTKSLHGIWSTAPDHSRLTYSMVQSPS
jgi:hypothetical protein